MITYLQGDATQPQAKGRKLIVHCCNDLGGWGKGFVLALSRRWTEPEQQYRQWHHERASNDFGLGAVQFVPVEEHIVVANLVGQRGIKRGSTGVPVRYEAIETGLHTVADHAVAVGASVHMPRIGCGLAGGKWTEVEPLIDTTLVEAGVAVFVYDFD